jgi:integrase
LAPKRGEARNTVILFSAMMKKAAQWAKSASDEQETAQRRLGHADPKTTAIYLRKQEPVAPIRRKLGEF